MSHHSDKTKLTIMVVDDDSDVLHVTKRGIESMGYKVHAFGNPVKALQHLESDCSDCELLVTDIRMPLMNGFQLVRRLREVRPDMKVVMMTAFEMNQSEFETVFPSMRVARVVRKPFSSSKLIEIIKAIYSEQDQST